MSQHNKQPDKPVFSFWRNLLFPVHREEMVKVLLASLLMSLLLFSYTTVRILKDTVIVNAPGCSAQTLTFVKGFCVIPSVFMLAFLFDFVRGCVNKKSYALFIMGFFGALFLLYAYVLAPYSLYLQPDLDYIRALQAEWPRLKDFIGIGGSWCHIFFYITADISGNALLTYCLWLLIGQITEKRDMSRMYPMYGMFGNIFGNIGAGISGIIFGRAAMEFTTLIRVRITVVVIALLLSMIITNYLYNNYTSPDVIVEDKVKKPKPSLKESIQLLLASKPLLYIAIIIVAYNMSINLAEVVFKEYMRIHSGSPEAFMNLLDSLYITIGITACAASIFNRVMANAFGWFGSAIIPTIIMFVTTTLFFSFSILTTATLNGSLSKTLEIIFENIGLENILKILVFFGAAQNVLGKVMKYIFIDPVVQAFYADLEPEVRNKGKLAIDMTGGRIGKSGGAVIQAGLLMATGLSSIINLSPYLFGLVLILIAGWVYAVFGLDHERKIIEEQKSNNQTN